MVIALAAMVGADEEEGDTEEADEHLEDSREQCADDEEEQFMQAHPPLPGHKPHYSTDKFWLILFLVALAGLAGVVHYGVSQGDIRRLSHGYDFEGRLCGVNGTGSYIFWCRERASGAIALHFPLCLSECPQGLLDTDVCADLTSIIGGAEAYDSRYFGTLCLPRQLDMLQVVFTRVAGRTIGGKLMRIASQVYTAKVVLVLSGVLATLLGYFYLHLVNKYAGTILLLANVSLVVAPLTAGIFCLHAYFNHGMDGVDGTGDGSTDLVLAGTLLALAPVMWLVGCCIRSGLASAIGCVEAAAECMFQEPSLLLEPVLASLFRMALFAALFIGFCFLVSCGEMRRPARGNGLYREFRHTMEQQYYLTYYLFMSVWLFEFFTAMSQYVIGWVAQMWYFTPYVNGHKLDAPRCGLLRGLYNAVRYHTGTLALGSLFQTIFRLPRFLCGLLAKASRNKSNPASACIGRLCHCCVACFNNFLVRLSKNAYMDVAITSSTYPIAAIRAGDILTTEVPAVAALHGSQFIFTVLGVSSISGAGCVLTLAAVRCLPVFNDHHSWLFVSNPKAVAACAGIISLLVAASFMTVLDTVADAVLYCFAIEQRRAKNRLLEAKALAAQEERGGCVMGWWPFGGDPATPLHRLEAAPRYAPPGLRKLLQ